MIRDRVVFFSFVAGVREADVSAIRGVHKHFELWTSSQLYDGLITRFAENN